MTKICAYNGWDPLKEVWLGDVWPEHFYDDFPADVKEHFKTITQWSKEDLSKIESFLTSFGIAVIRPKIDNDSSLYHFHNTYYNKTVMVKPPIAVRDYTAVIGDTLYISDSVTINGGTSPWQETIDRYRQVGQKVSTNHPGTLSTANITRVGQDLIFDHADYSLVKNSFLSKVQLDRIKNIVKNWKLEIEHFSKDYRCWLSLNGGHTDGCFSVVKPGLVLGNSYWPDYEQSFPGWEKIFLDKPEWRDHKYGNGFLPKWFVPDLPPTGRGVFNEFVMKHAKPWVGNYRETYFTVNLLILDSKNVVAIGKHDPIFEELEKRGITVHVLPFRCSTFWDAGIHCITADISRESTKIDYWPGRGSNGFYSLENRIIL